MRHITRFALGTLALAIPATTSAQTSGPSVGDIAAYAALITSPTGGLVPSVTSTMAGVGQSKFGVGVRYGRVDGDGGALNNFAATGTMGVAKMATVSLTAGMRNASSDVGSSQNDFIFGVGGDMMLAQRALSESEDAAKFILGLNADIGYGSGDGASSTAASVGVPLSLSFNGSGSSKIVPFLTPAFGYGRVSVDGEGSESGSRFMFGGGVGLHQISNGVSVNFGFQKVLIDQGKMAWGLGVTLGGQ